jgi:alpha-1,6-mannosyltransferase
VFSPARHDPAMRARWAAPDDVLLLHCGRLSAEKKPRRSLAALAELLARPACPRCWSSPAAGRCGRPAGGGAERGLPVRFLGHLRDRAELAALLATVDVAIAPGPVETFGLAALEALASGTPVVVSAQSALPEVIGSAGLAARSDASYGAAVRTLLDRPDRRAAARARAELFPLVGVGGRLPGGHHRRPSARQSTNLKPVLTRPPSGVFSPSCSTSRPFG